MYLRAGGMLLVLAALWGGSFIALRVAVPVVGPLPVITLRVWLAVGALLAYSWAIHRLPSLRGRWRTFVLLGVLNAALPFLFIASAELWLTASLAATLNATTPLFTAMVAAVWGLERLTPLRLLGVLLGLVGVAVAVGWSPLPLTFDLLVGAGMSLLGALCYGKGGVYSKLRFAGVPPTTMAIGQQLGAGLVLLPFAAVNLPSAAPSFAVVVAIVALGLLSTALAYLIYFRLMAQVGPTVTHSVTFLVPVFSMLWGTLLLGEPISGGLLVGLGIISLGMICIMRVPSLARAGQQVGYGQAPREDIASALEQR